MSYTIRDLLFDKYRSEIESIEQDYCVEVDIENDCVFASFIEKDGEVYVDIKMDSGFEHILNTLRSKLEDYIYG